MTEKRQAKLQPISEQLTAALTSVSGEGDQTPLQSAPASPKAPREIVESKLIPCDRRGHNAAMLIFAYDAKTVADFENHARKMYVKYSDLNVPTWIIGEPVGILVAFPHSPPNSTSGGDHKTVHFIEISPIVQTAQIPTALCVC